MTARLETGSAIDWSGWQIRNGLAACCAALCFCSGFAVQAQDTSASDGTSGPAVNWSLKSKIGLKLDGDINRQLNAGVQDSGITLGVDAGLILGAEAKRGDAKLDFGVSRTFFLGEDQPATDNAEGLDPRLSLSGTYRGKSYMLSGDLGFAFQPTSFTQDEDTGITNDETTQLTINYDAGLLLELNRVNQLTISTDSRIVDFSDPAPDLVPTRTFGADIAWQHSLTKTTTLTVTGGGRYFTAQNPQDTKSTTIDVTVGLEHQRTRRHTFGWTAGVTAVRTNEIGALGFRETEFTFGATGAASLGYALKNLKVRLELSQSVDPSANGALQSFTRARSDLSYDVNEREQLGLRANLFRRTPLSDGTTSTLHSFTIGPTYSLELLPETMLTMGYLFRMKDDSVSGNATGHRVFLTLTQNFEIFP